MKRIKITVMRMACYTDLMEKYENPIEHACTMKLGQVFIAEGWQKPQGFCDSAWDSVSPFVMTLARDILIFNAHGYTLAAATALDMFPRTSHVETVCLMSRA